MKKFLSGVIAGALVFGTLGVFAGAEYFAQKAAFKVFVNGEEFHGTTGDILDVNNRTYLPLRDMGNALGIEVEWNEELGQVEVGTKPDAPKVVTLSKGNYIVGTDIPAGKYDLYAVSGTGNLMGEVKSLTLGYINEILAKDDEYFPNCDFYDNLVLQNGDFFQITYDLVIDFVKQ